MSHAFCLLRAVWVKRQVCHSTWRQPLLQARTLEGGCYFMHCTKVTGSTVEVMTLIKVLVHQTACLQASC